MQNLSDVPNYDQVAIVTFAVVLCLLYFIVDRCANREGTHCKYDTRPLLNRPSAKHTPGSGSPQCLQTCLWGQPSLLFWALLAQLPETFVTSIALAQPLPPPQCVPHSFAATGCSWPPARFLLQTDRMMKGPGLQSCRHSAASAVQHSQPRRMLSSKRLRMWITTCGRCWTFAPSRSWRSYMAFFLVRPFCPARRLRRLSICAAGVTCVCTCRCGGNSDYRCKPLMRLSCIRGDRCQPLEPSGEEHCD
jgi:hypothetical protein